ncbi:MAG: hypothetical protein ABS944_03490 [Solibacillus sp.]|uniref:hypothetical protein n=1 Tax=unclassified Solibacillus TaxID=2637870 RepID=UPI0030F9FD72
MAKENQKNSQIKKEEFGVELGPDDLDLREDNDLTEEQKKNSQQAKLQQNEKPKKK